MPPFRLQAVIRSLMCFALLGLASCQKRESSKASEAAAVSAAVAVDSIGEFDPIANVAALPGGTYTSWSGGFPKSLNMWLDYNSFSTEVMSYLFENLVSLHSVKDEPAGMLARSWEISRDGRIFTFHLDPRALERRPARDGPRRAVLLRRHHESP